MKTVFFDIDTQMDFVLPAGALYARGAERIVDRVGALNRKATAAGSVVISTMDAHTEADAEFRIWPGHCVAGTLGQRKPDCTLLAKRVVVPSIPGQVSIAGAEQVLLEKQHLDCFTNPNLPGILDTLAAERYVVYGVVTEYCVKFAALGLLATGKRVEVVADAVCSLNDADGRAMFAEFEQRGGVITTSASLL